MKWLPHATSEEHLDPRYLAPSHLASWARRPRWSELPYTGPSGQRQMCHPHLDPTACGVGGWGRTAGPHANGAATSRTASAGADTGWRELNLPQGPSASFAGPEARPHREPHHCVGVTTAQDDGHRVGPPPSPSRRGHEPARGPSDAAARRCSNDRVSPSGELDGLRGAPTCGAPRCPGAGTRLPHSQPWAVRRAERLAASQGGVDHRPHEPPLRRAAESSASPTSELGHSPRSTGTPLSSTLTGISAGSFRADSSGCTACGAPSECGARWRRRGRSADLLAFPRPLVTKYRCRSYTYHSSFTREECAAADGTRICNKEVSPPSPRTPPLPPSCVYRRRWSYVHSSTKHARASHTHGSSASSGAACQASSAPPKPRGLAAASVQLARSCGSERPAATETSTTLPTALPLPATVTRGERSDLTHWGKTKPCATTPNLSEGHKSKESCTQLSSLGEGMNRVADIAVCSAASPRHGTRGSPPKKSDFAKVSLSAHAVAPAVAPEPKQYPLVRFRSPTLDSKCSTPTRPTNDTNLRELRDYDNMLHYSHRDFLLKLDPVEAQARAKDLKSGGPTREAHASDAVGGGSAQFGPSGLARSCRRPLLFSFPGQQAPEYDHDECCATKSLKAVSPSVSLTTPETSALRSTATYSARAALTQNDGRRGGPEVRCSPPRSSPAIHSSCSQTSSETVASSSRSGAVRDAEAVRTIQHVARTVVKPTVEYLNSQTSRSLEMARILLAFLRHVEEISPE